MDRDELIKKAAEFCYPGGFQKGDYEYPIVAMADFALEMIESQAMQFADNITANKEAHREGYEAGRRAERERIVERVRLMPYAWHTQELLAELRQTEPAESGE